MQIGFEFTYFCEHRMTGTMILQGSDPPVRKELGFHVGSSTVCLDKPGIWELFPDP